MTKSKRYQELSSEQLVARYVEIGIAQDDALLGMEIRKFNRIFDELVEIQSILEARPGDQRRLLLSLYDHPNMQVRLNAANATWGVDRLAARAQLEAIAASGHQPQAGMPAWGCGRSTKDQQVELRTCERWIRLWLRVRGPFTWKKPVGSR